MNVFVGCSSRDIENEDYNRIAEGIGNFIVSKKHNLIFGGCDRGLMGKIYSIVSQSTTSKIFVAMAEAYKDDLKTLSYDNVALFDTVSERKDYSMSIADIMIFLPGGIGTIDELLTAIEACRVNDYSFPILVINANNYFDHLEMMLASICNEGYADLSDMTLFHIVNSLDEAMEFLSTFPEGDFEYPF